MISIMLKCLLCLSIVGCSAIQQSYMVEPNWDNGDSCWRYGNVRWGVPRYDVRDIPVVRTDLGDIEGCIKGSNGCYVPAVQYFDDPGIIYLPNHLYAGYFEEIHERCHAFGAGHNLCHGVYAVDKEDC